ncbi:hypothetical protein DRO97_04460 [Archaeoglobales archaeon]|nr:MAG: hypothetical protein DRO97_04460 [Archaeoglobales archaeon]
MPALLITTARGEEFLGKFEAEEILTSLGIKTTVEETGIRGLLFAEVANPIEAVIRIEKMVKEKHELFLHTKRYIPLENVIRTDIEEMKECVKDLLYKIGKNETFRITVEKRYTTLHSKDIIDSIAKVVNRKVDLKNPDWIVLVEVFGSKTGISVIKPGQIVSTVKK